jgi:hypothetical protein
MEKLRLKTGKACDAFFQSNLCHLSDITGKHQTLTEEIKRKGRGLRNGLEDQTLKGPLSDFTHDQTDQELSLLM